MELRFLFVPVSQIIQRPVNRVIHSEQEQIRSGVGSLFHHKEAYAPAVVVTDLDGNFLLSNRPRPKDNDEPVWTINSARVMVTRFWSASTAYVTAVIHVPDQGQFVPAPPIELLYEHQFRIWMGYLERPRPVEPDDLCNRLLPVFLGSVDTHAVHCTSEGGYTFSIQARDRMKWFMDSETSITPTMELSSGSGCSAGGRDASSRGKRGLRSEIIRSILGQAIGQMVGGTECHVCGMYFQRQEDGDVHDLGQLGCEVQEMPEADVFYKGEYAAAPDNCTKKASPHPRLRQYITRDWMLDAGGASNGYVFDRKIPIEIIKQLLLQEAYPMEFYQDQRTGDIFISPRANDISSLPETYGGGRDSGGRKELFYRTYFFKVYPEDYYPDHNQMLIAFKDEMSSAGAKTNFEVNKHHPDGNGSAFWTAGLYVRPFGFPTDAPCRTHIADDTTITTAEQAAVVAVQLARIFGRETRAGMAILTGDPSFIPGDVIQVVGSPLMGHAPGRFLRTNQDLVDYMKADRERVHDLNKAYNSQLPSDYANLDHINLGDDTSFTEQRLPHPSAGVDYIISGPEEQEGSNQVRCSMKEKVTELPPDPLTIWRVEGIMHKFDFTQGYTTELALASPV